MTAISPKALFASPLAVYCRSIAAPMAGYCRFRTAANVPTFRKLRSDYPLLFTSCNCLRQHRCAQVHRFVMSNRIASSGARSRTARLVLGLCWQRKNRALCPKHNLSSGYLHKFVSPDTGPISLNTERNGCSLTSASSRTLSVCTTLFTRRFDLEDQRVTLELPTLKLQTESCFDKRNVTYRSLNLGSMVRKQRSTVNHLTARFHQLIEDSCAREGCRNHSCISTKEEHYVSQ